MPVLGPFDFAPERGAYPEVGLYWSIHPAHRRHGYATEAGRALIDFAFDSLRLRHIVATTTFDNEPSIGVMQKLGMHITRNPTADPPWLQVLGVLERDSPG